MPSDFQVICGSMVGKNRQSLTSAETPENRVAPRREQSLNQMLLQTLKGQY